MSITECMTVTSPSPTNGPKARRPDALGDTITFGIADGQRVHGGRAEQRALRPAEAQHAVHAALGCRASRRSRGRPRA